MSCVSSNMYFEIKRELFFHPLESTVGWRICRLSLPYPEDCSVIICNGPRFPYALPQYIIQELRGQYSNAVPYLINCRFCLSLEHKTRYRIKHLACSALAMFNLGSNNSNIFIVESYQLLLGIGHPLNGDNR